MSGLAPDIGATLPSFGLSFALYAILGRLQQRAPSSATAGS